MCQPFYSIWYVDVSIVIILWVSIYDSMSVKPIPVSCCWCSYLNKLPCTYCTCNLAIQMVSFVLVLYYHVEVNFSFIVCFSGAPESVSPRGIPTQSAWCHRRTTYKKYKVRREEFNVSTPKWKKMKISQLTLMSAIPERMLSIVKALSFFLQWFSQLDLLPNLLN